ncbi:MAG: phosphate ABC transporter substrate-binding protein PstS, partial [Actinomycetes bacterium]
ADCGSGTLQAAGSSAQKPAMTAWITAYQQACSSAAINYDAQGSGYGIQQFSQGQVPLAGSDSHLKPEEQTAADQRCKTGKAIDLPMVATPVAFIYNISGVDKLTVTPEVLAKIFSGAITTWNDPEIAKANPGVTLPATTITAVHRSKDSGTTDNFTKFLDAQAKDAWTFGTGKAWKAPGGIGAPDSAALVSQVKGTDGAIGYVDGPDATKNQLTPALLDVGSGPVAISADSVGKALDAADVSQSGNDIKVDINYGLTAAGTYPAILVTYEITCDAGLPAEQASFVKSFLTYTSSAEGQGALSAIGHLPLPDSLISKVRSSVGAIQTS